MQAAYGFSKTEHNVDLEPLHVGSANPLFSSEDVTEANKFIKGIEAAAGESRGGM